MSLESLPTPDVTSLQTRLLNHLTDRGLTGKGKLALAVSGGLDSVVMLDLFHRLREPLELRLAVFHVDHGLRETSGADLQFIRNLALRYGIAFHSRRVDVKGNLQERKYSVEEAARELRYAAFEEMSLEAGCSNVATAHTLNDQAETVLDRLMRGAGVLGLSGMRGQRGRYIRPMLIFLRKELEDYAHENNLEFREDETNRELAFKRNRIRHKLIPLLEKEFNPAVVTTLSRASHVFSEVEDFLTAYANEIFPDLVRLQKKNQIVLEIGRFLDYFNVIQKYVLFKALEQFSLSRSILHYDLLQSILSAINRRQVGVCFELNAEVQLLIDHDGIVLQRKQRIKSENLAVTVTDFRECQFGNFTFKWKILERSDRVNYKTELTVGSFDYHEVGDSLRFRTFKPGDRFIPLNLDGSKKVADFFSDRKVPLRRRPLTPILESPKGIVWICGYGIDDRFKVTERTKKILQMEVTAGSDAI